MAGGRQGGRTRETRASKSILLVAFCGLLPACGPSLYAFQSIPASSAVHSAEQAGAAEHAPYEYWSAHAYLDKAAEEANEGNYDDAIRFAERARALGTEAQQQTSARMRERREAQ